MQQVGNAIGLIVGLAVVAVIATHPGAITAFFSGLSGAVTAASRG